MKEKRVNKNKAGGSSGNANIVKKGEITVQRLSSEVQGKAQKYVRIGPREFVSFPHDNLSLTNLKDACQKHFESRIDENMVCDILAGDQGPSCTSLEQLPNFNVIHVRFVESRVINSRVSVLSSTVNMHNKRPGPTTSLPTAKKMVTNESKIYPKSLSVVEMLKLGKIIQSESSYIMDVYGFDVHTMTWSGKARSVEFVLEKDVLGTGGFREVFKATSKTPGFADIVWVVKKYLPEALTIIQATNQSVEEQTKKVIQMHMLAKNMAEQLIETLKKNGNLQRYGQTLKYKKVFMGQPENVIVEEFVEGEFVKYINNNGALCGDESELRQKAESLTHFSHEKSDHQLMLVDIQGSGYDLYDPEIASKELMSDSGEEVMFAAGNLTTLAIDTFMQGHTCNKYCELLGLTVLA